MLSIIFAQDPTPCPPGAVGENCASGLYSLTDVFGRIVSSLLPIGGIILFVMLIVGGFYFIFSGGDPRQVAGAKSTITYAIAGTVVLALAFLIVQIIANFVGVPAILNFDIYN